VFRVKLGNALEFISEASLNGLLRLALARFYFICFRPLLTLVKLSENFLEFFHDLFLGLVVEYYEL
jgi:hypothetical protein